MNKIFTVMKKELKRFFTDKRLLASLVLPGIMIFVIYSFMGSFFSDMFGEDPDKKFIIQTINAPSSFSDDLKATGLNAEVKAVEDKDASKEEVKNKSADILVFFEEEFERKLSEGEQPSVEIWYNTVNTQSQTAYNAVYGMIYSRSVEVKTVFVLNGGEGSYDLATKEETSAMIITMMLPFILMIFLFSGAMAVATESIAGEKERGTIATLLVTPIKRSSLALGKILALSVTAIVSSLVSFVGLIASLPKLMGGMGDIDMGMYGVGTYLGVLGVIVVTVVMFTVVLSIISALAKSVKEASQLALPVMFVVMLVGVSSMIGSGGANPRFWAYLIPVYNSTQCLAGLFSLSFDPLFFLITVITNILFIALGVYILAKIFNSEKIIYNK
ncbi:MAG: ABC transporter permease [Clostridia bacterium]|nr:ABC transporter permease [Clostridia bacterium]